ncbi:MAG: hypothetical protein AAF788_03310 [Pseudomonadota bacterium]
MNTFLRPKPGFARRREDFESLKQECLGVSLSPITRIDLDRSIAQGTSELSAGARCLLAFYASHLSLDHVHQGKTGVFPGTARATACLGISPATLRRHKAELEEAGYLIRCYDRRNRPLEGGAIDLRPLLSKVPAMLKHLTADQQSLRHHWQDNRSPDEASSMNTQERTLEPLNRTKNSSVNSLVSSEDNKEEKTNLSQKMSSSIEVQDQNLIDQVLASSPTLRAALAEDFSGQTPEPMRLLREALPKLFPQETATSISHTGLWAEQRLGASMFAAVAIALEDPDVRRSAAYFGRLVTQAEDYDPTENLKRLKDLHPAKIQRPQHDDPLSEEFTKALAKELGEAATASWFAPQAFQAVRTKPGELTLKFAHGFALRTAQDRHADAISRTATSLGYTTLVFKQGLDLEPLCANP